MSLVDSPIELVRTAIQDVYRSPLTRESYSALSHAITLWDNCYPPSDEGEDRRIFDGLQSLITFLQNKGYNSEAEEVMSFVLKFFPENYFPELPHTHCPKELDLNLFAEAKKVLASKHYSEKIQEAFSLFEEQFRMANLNLPLLASEITTGMFQQEGIGRAAELFRRFADAAIALQDTDIRDTPWELMNKLAMKINNTISGFNQAYLLLKAIESVKTARPAGWLRDEIVRNQNFFLRNYCWKNIDEAIAAKDKSQIIYWIDKFLPFVRTGYERSNLLMLRESTVMQMKPFPKAILIAFAAIFILVAIISMIWLEPKVKKSLNLEQSRKEIIRAIKYGLRMESKQPRPDDAPQIDKPVIEVISRTRLREVKPPMKPHGRPLNLWEIRHVVFQRHRLDYLKEQNLSDAESRKLEILEDDWRSRCDFYDYSNEDREKVYWDLKIHSPTLIQDAQDILSSWRDNNENETKTLASSELLSLNNPFHMKIIIKRLRQLGCYKALETPLIWNEECNRALIEFKATHLSIVDSVWDRKTQNALFGQ